MLSKNVTMSIFEVHCYTKLFSKYFVRLWAFYRLKSSSFFFRAERDVWFLLRYASTCFNILRVGNLHWFPQPHPVRITKQNLMWIRVSMK